jgi:hypothetical protein
MCTAPKKRGGGGAKERRKTKHHGGATASASLSASMLHPSRLFGTVFVSGTWMEMVFEKLFEIPL